MKKKISLLLAILMLVTLIPTAFAESKTVDAVKNTKKITLDGEEVKIGAYDVEGFNYLKLRDVAAILNTKKCQFNVGFDKPTKLITVELAKGYEKVEGDLAEIKDEKAKAIVSVRKILVNGEEKEIKTALINEYNYMQLRDLGSLVGLDVKYDKVNKVIMLNSDTEAKEEAPRYVMIKSKLYKDTGEINKNMTCGTMDGKILTTVDAKEMPKKNNESNFGIGYEYQIGAEDGSITVKIDDKCLIFKEVKEEKKDEKTEEKKEEKWSYNDNVIFTTLINIVNASIDRYKDYSLIPFTGDDGQDTIIEQVNLSILYGQRIYTDGAKIEKSIEMRDGVKTYIVKFTYPSGAYNTVEGSVDEKDTLSATDKMVVGPIIGFIDKEKNIDKMPKDELLAKFTKAHDAIADGDYKKACEVLRELNYDADEAKLKKIVNIKKEDAKKLGGDVFLKDYEASIDANPFGNGEYILITFKYKDGSLLRFDVQHDTILGLGLIAAHN